MDEILAAAAEFPGGLAILDLNLGDDPQGQFINACDLVRALRRMRWKVFVVSASSDPRRIAPAIAAGAIGTMAKSAPFDALLKTILAIMSGKETVSERERQVWLERHRSHLAPQREPAERINKLTNRERAVLDMLVEGHRAADIANKHVVSVATVRSHIQSILSKLSVKSQLEAVALIHEYRDYSRCCVDPRLPR